LHPPIYLLTYLLFDTYKRPSSHKDQLETVLIAEWS